MNRKACFALLALATCVVGLFAAAPAGAIIGGERDTVHTSVGLVRFTTADGRFRCSGTLISPTVVLTAGHCTEGPATGVYVSFDTDLALDPLAPNITPEEKANREAHYITGTAHPDPGWTGKLSFAKQHDQGVVVLDAPATSKWPDIVPAQLPPVGFLNRNQGQEPDRRELGRHDVGHLDVAGASSTTTPWSCCFANESLPVQPGSG